MRAVYCFELAASIHATIIWQQKNKMPTYI